MLPEPQAPRAPSAVGFLRLPNPVGSLGFAAHPLVSMCVSRLRERGPRGGDVGAGGRGGGSACSRARPPDAP